MHGTALLLLLVVIAAPLQLISAQAFINPPLTSTAYDPSGLASGDFNHDSDPDLVYVDGSVPTVRTLHVLLGDGLGAFTRVQDIGLPAGICQTACRITVTDVTGDGNRDLIMGNSSQPSVLIAVLLGNADGTFQSAVESTFTTPGNFPSLGIMAVADVNGDGSPDLVAPDAMNGRIFVLTGDRTGKFGLRTTMTGGGTWIATYVVDINGDAKLDLIAIEVFGGRFGVFTGNGNATFNTPTYYGGAGFRLVFDVDNDGHIDVLGTRSAGEIVFAKGNSDGSFSALSAIGRMPSNATPVGTGDFNGDGYPDLEVLTPAGVGILCGGPGPLFASMITSSSGVSSVLNPPWPAAGDFNSDGRLDLAVGAENGIVLLAGLGDGAFAGSGKIYDLEKSVGAIVVADFNSDRRPDIAVGQPADIPRLLLNQSAGEFVLGPDPNAVYATDTRNNLASGDFNGDGRADLVIFPPTGGPKVLFGDGGSGFSSSSPAANGSSLLADFNGDLRTDMIVVAAGDLVVSLGNANGTLGTVSTRLQSVTFPVITGIGDLNNDGKPDLIISGHGGTVAVWVGNGNGGFTAPGGTENLSAFATIGITPQSAVVADFDRDGSGDFAFSNSTRQLVILYGNGNGGFASPQVIPISPLY